MSVAARRSLRRAVSGVQPAIGCDLIEAWSCQVEPCPSTNALYIGRRWKTDEYKAWIAVAGAQINLARGDLRKPFKRCEISVRVPYNGRRDCDNFLKPLIDQLVRMRIIERDNMKCVRRITIEVDDGATAVSVSVSALA